MRHDTKVGWMILAAAVVAIAVATGARAGTLGDLYKSEYEITQGQLASLPSDKVRGFFLDTVDVCNQATTWVNAGDYSPKLIQVVAICEAVADEVELRDLGEEPYSFIEGEYRL